MRISQIGRFAHVLRVLDLILVFRCPVGQYSQGFSGVIRFAHHFAAFRAQCPASHDVGLRFPSLIIPFVHLLFKPRSPRMDMMYQALRVKPPHSLRACGGHGGFITRFVKLTHKV